MKCKLPINLLIILCICGLCVLSYANEEIDLNLLISGYEDEGITVSDLATFLTAHGYSAQSSDHYVTIKLPSGKNLYMLPNGGETGLASLWIVPPSSKAKQSGEKHSEPRMTFKEGEIRKDKTYTKTANGNFIETIRKVTNFPVAPLGMCEDGAQILGKAYKNSGYNTYYMVHPNSDNHPGHMWVVVEDPAQKNTWLAVDSYFGPITKDDDYYYSAPYSFKDNNYLKLIDPVLRIS
jgi:hypothetical protein